VTDTAEKRASAMWVGLPFRHNYPLLDGTLDDSDRAQTAFLYRGFDYAGDGSGGPSGTVAEFIIRSRRRVLR
jgi:hypothetical protein